MLPRNLRNILAVAENEHKEELREFSVERRLMQNRSDPFTLNDGHFRDLFRLTKDMAHYVFNSIIMQIAQKTSVLAINPTLYFFAALYFYTTGSYQRTVGQSYNLLVSQQSVSKAIVEVTEAIINQLGHEWIRFPTTDVEKNNLKTRFMGAVWFPGAIRAIDCTHVAIIAPTAEEHNYVNRKGFHSKNVQIVSLLFCRYDQLLI